MLSALVAACESASEKELNSNVITTAEEIIKDVDLARFCFIHRPDTVAAARRLAQYSATGITMTHSRRCCFQDRSGTRSHDSRDGKNEPLSLHFTIRMDRAGRAALRCTDSICRRK